MSNESVQIFRTSFLLKYTYLVNSIIYSIKQFPGLKQILPVLLYQNRGLKLVANVIASIWEVISTFAGKALYLSLAIFFPLSFFETLPREQVFLHLFFVLTLIGSYMNTYMFNPTNDKYYAMFLLRMDAQKYTLVNYGYSILKVIIGFLPCTLIFGILSSVSLWVCVIFPFSWQGLRCLWPLWSWYDIRKQGNTPMRLCHRFMAGLWL